jgi:GH25 family lysozyme M1 (1,4-beta-N-acetylmuramidase)
MIRKGIDVSYAQGKVNWGAVKASGQVDFAIIRAGFGREVSQEDSQFKNNYVGCKMNNIPVGVYWYSYAESVEDAKAEARACLEVIKGKQFEYPIYFDIEESFQFSQGKSFCTAITKAFLEVIEKAGYYGGIYCSSSYLKGYIDKDLRENKTVWLAAYTGDLSIKPDYYEQYGMWQYTGSGKTVGIEGNVDLNICYSDYPTKIKSKGLNGFKKSSSDPIKGDVNNDGKVDVRDSAKIAKDLSEHKKLPKQADFNNDGKTDVRDASAIARSLSHKKSVDDIAKEVIQGKWGNGEERKQRLTSAGYNYEEVQSAVNKLV